MKATMNHPEVNDLAVFELSPNALENVAGGDGSGFIRNSIVYGLIWTTLTLYGFESMPDDFEEYFNFMIVNEALVLIIMYKSLEDIHDPLFIEKSINYYKRMLKIEKRNILQEVYNKFK